ncbi:MAG: hypothetical protein H9535_05480 [Ignavibacteria bacterium]|nr:hypothetical protein [Ignavibacteria bacterium]
MAKQQSTKTDSEIVEIARHVLLFRLQNAPHLFTPSDLIAVIQHFEGKPNDNNS